LSRLCYAGQNLLTPAPSNFRPPTANYGKYETRPVYGYDDCFPTVDPCDANGWSVPDHGELCWLPWQATAGDDYIRFRCQSEKLPAAFERCMNLTASAVTWQFQVTNSGDRGLSFVHVMHALMPLREVVGMRFPRFSAVVDETCERNLEISSPEELEEHLFALEGGKACMLLLRDIRPGAITITFRSGMRLEINFSNQLFPTLGIWWNNDGYPDDEGCQRAECAFEPIPGKWSSLAASIRDGTAREAPAHGSVKWAIDWKVYP
jgi:hypothetical protein